ncbi:hypothetical protein DMA12_40265 [Amycolatopsis balhimycina DSM 5908]|uniref:Uncharacterized protein n=1 Tax=Amycolatopsis balhimycina DSM 5908 TaxID=1081091 RepID=A0A428W061_AMYBA|nr:hypothetical protein DMA12_40265 [Amycolatopsis balhimycina DSM 5908]
MSALLTAPRVAGLALSCDGLRLLATVEVPNAAKSRSVQQLWEIPLTGGAALWGSRSLLMHSDLRQWLVRR